MHEGANPPINALYPPRTSYAVQTIAQRANHNFGVTQRIGPFLTRITDDERDLLSVYYCERKKNTLGKCCVSVRMRSNRAVHNDYDGSCKYDVRNRFNALQLTSHQLTFRFPSSTDSLKSKTRTDFGTDREIGWIRIICYYVFGITHCARFHAAFK